MPTSTWSINMIYLGCSLGILPSRVYKDLYTQIYILGALLFISGLLASLPLITTAVQTRLVAVMHPVCSWRTDGGMQTTCVVVGGDA